MLDLIQISQQPPPTGSGLHGHHASKGHPTHREHGQGSNKDTAQPPARVPVNPGVYPGIAHLPPTLQARREPAAAGFPSHPSSGSGAEPTSPPADDKFAALSTPVIPANSGIHSELIDLTFLPEAIPLGSLLVRGFASGFDFRIESDPHAQDEVSPPHPPVEPRQWDTAILSSSLDNASKNVCPDSPFAGYDASSSLLDLANEKEVRRLEPLLVPAIATGLGGNNSHSKHGPSLAPNRDSGGVLAEDRSLNAVCLAGARVADPAISNEYGTWDASVSEGGESHPKA
jgi:hypothetical protein